MSAEALLAPSPPDGAECALASRASRDPGSIALSWDRGRMSYGELNRRVEEFASHVRTMGIAGGAAVAIAAPSSPRTVAALFGARRAGCVAVPLHDGLAPDELEYARRLVNPSLHYDNYGLHSVSLDGLARDGSKRFASFPDVAVAILTSGSSAAPKAVGLTGRSLAASANAVASRLGLSSGDRWGLCLSLGHIGGFSLLERAIATGASVWLWPSFDAGLVTRALMQGEVTHLSVVPVMLRRIMERLGARRPPTTLRCVLVGGAGAPTSLLEEAWEMGIPVATTWGMTETASQVASAPPALARSRPGTAGPSLAGTEVRCDSAGRLLVRGPTLAAALVRRPGVAADPIPLDREGWFATGDSGRVDDEGLVWVEGRADDMILSGGLNVSPSQVEGVIQELDGVSDAVVFGVPDEEWGELVAAVVEADSHVVDPDGVDRHCRRRMARGRCPTRIVVVDELKRTQAGKVVRAGIEERLAVAAGGGR
ncbi:MAG: acyl--CoA ligase [Gemmatimonadetes bacterium]|nr:acyl--CoA ligase [Gemmatimonadota bacterium]